MQINRVPVKLETCVGFGINVSQYFTWAVSDAEKLLRFLSSSSRKSLLYIFYIFWGLILILSIKYSVYLSKKEINEAHKIRSVVHSFLRENFLNDFELPSPQEEAVQMHLILKIKCNLCTNWKREGPDEPQTKAIKNQSINKTEEHHR